MYPSVRSGPDAVASPTAETSARARVLSQNLVALGLTSFFTDISSEMVLAVVPLFLTTTLGFSIIGFGLFEAAYQATGALFRVWGGSIADRAQRHKRTAASGYGISALTRFGLLASALVAWVPAVPFLLADRIGKGLRTAPRDALISLSTPPDRLAMAFGIHRTLDTAGAMLGPLVAFAVLTVAPGAFDAVFVVSAIAAVIGVSIIVTFAQEKPQADRRATRGRRLREQWASTLRQPGMPAVAGTAMVLSAFTVSDAFIYLVIQRTTDLSARYFPLLFAGTAIAYLVLAVPVGRLADHIGTRRVFVAGHALLVALYVVMATTDLTTPITVLILALLGSYYASTDGVIAAIASSLVPGEIRGTGIACVTVAIAAAKMLSAVVFGLVWQSLGTTAALLLFAAGLIAAIVSGWYILNRSSAVEGVA